MSLITTDYIEQNRKLFESRAEYATSGHRWSEIVATIAVETAAASILDYGCGRETLKDGLPASLKWMTVGYDPCVPGLDQPPKPADLVVCTDVLEHVEPECLEEVLDHMQGLAKRRVFLVVSTVVAQKTLDDGRNAHLTVEDYKWWVPKLWDRWRMTNFILHPSKFVFVGETV